MRRLKGALFPITLLSFAGVGILYFDIVFTQTTRWVFLALLFGLLALWKRLFEPFRSSFGLPLLAYCGWALLTFQWSLVPQLSLLKAIACIAIVMTFSAAGQYWVNGWTSNRPLFYLAPVVLAALTSLMGGHWYGGTGGQIYQGLTGNPNYLGILVASSVPFAFFFLVKAFRSSSKKSWSRWMAVLLMAGLALLLWRAGSRSGILCAMTVVLCGVLTFRLSKLVSLGLIGVFILVFAVVAIPQIQDQMYERFVVKYSQEQDVFATRRDVWAESMKGAEEGGWFGLGYGASYGDTEYSVGFTSVGYGREKGNSQLAIVEETGLVGLALYAVLLASIFRSLFRAIARAPDADSKLELMLSIGLIIGLLEQSVFEAWWTAPGSMESAIFWSTVGVGTGLARRWSRDRANSVARNRRQLSSVHQPLAYRP